MNEVSASWSILSIALVGPDIWLATTEGLQRCVGQHCEPITAPAPLNFVSLIAQPGGQGSMLLAAGLPAEIVYSLNGGQHWDTAWTDGIETGVVCLAASPRVAMDQVLLAGTEQDGILRSTDGGRHWRLVNVGLTEFTILAMATSPCWENREEALAATDGGLYRSPNGGRAWKRSDSGLEGQIVQALAYSPQPAANWMIYAGCEGAPLHRSQDGGRTWQMVAHGPVNVNCLWVSQAQPDLWIAGTSDGQIYRSTDGGQSWAAVFTGNDAILTLSANNTLLYAGRYDGGLLVSSTLGAAWELHTKRGYVDQRPQLDEPLVPTDY